ENLSRNRIEVKSCFKAANLPKIKRKEIKEKSSFILSIESDHLSFVIAACLLIDILDICCFTPKPWPVINNLTVNFFRMIIYKRHIKFHPSRRDGQFLRQLFL